METQLRCYFWPGWGGYTGISAEHPALGSLQSIQSSAADGADLTQSSLQALGALLPFTLCCFKQPCFSCPEALGQCEPLRNLSCCVIPNSTKLLLAKIHSCSLMFLLFNLHDFYMNADSSQFSFKGCYLQSSLSVVRTHKGFGQNF